MGDLTTQHPPLSCQLGDVYSILLGPCMASTLGTPGPSLVVLQLKN